LDASLQQEDSATASTLAQAAKANTKSNPSLPPTDLKVDLAESEPQTDLKLDLTKSQLQTDLKSDLAENQCQETKHKSDLTDSTLATIEEDLSTLTTPPQILQRETNPNHSVPQATDLNSDLKEGRSVYQPQDTIPLLKLPQSSTQPKSELLQRNSDQKPRESRTRCDKATDRYSAEDRKGAFEIAPEQADIMGEEHNECAVR
jgi:hypothetical protein